MTTVPITETVGPQATATAHTHAELFESCEKVDFSPQTSNSRAPSTRINDLVILSCWS